MDCEVSAGKEEKYLNTNFTMEVGKENRNHHNHDVLTGT